MKKLLSGLILIVFLFCNLNIVLVTGKTEDESKALIMETMASLDDIQKTTVVIIVLNDESIREKILNGNIVPKCVFLKEKSFGDGFLVQFETVEDAETAVWVLNEMSSVRYAEMDFIRVYDPLPTPENTIAENMDVWEFQIGNSTYTHGQQGIAIDPNNLKVTPFIDNASGRTMIPLRCLAEAIGFNVEWFDEDQKVVMIKGVISISCTIGQQTLYLELKPPINPLNRKERFTVDNPGKYEMDGSPLILSGRTFVPVRFVAELLGYNVNWENDTKTITLVKRDFQTDIVKNPIVRQQDGKCTFGISIENKTKVPILGVFAGPSMRVQLFDENGNNIPIGNPSLAAGWCDYIAPNEKREWGLNPQPALLLEPGEYTASMTTGAFSYFDESLNETSFIIKFEVKTEESE